MDESPAAPSAPPAAVPTRAKILEALERRPGARLRDLSKELGASRSTAKHHLEILQRTGAIETLQTRHATHYFPQGFGTEDATDVAILRRGRVLEVAREILNEPGRRQRELTERVRISRRVFRLYADLLLQRDLIQERPGTNSIRYYPAERLVPLMERAHLDAGAKGSLERGA